MPPTERLHYDDPLLLVLDARVTAHATHAGHGSIVLDRTVFYPESGGQMADRGSLSGLGVVDVQLDDEGIVHHVVDVDPAAVPVPALPAVGTTVRAQVDGPRRRLHMALHTGQHMLSRALLDLAQASTRGVRLGESACTIDLDVHARDLRDDVLERVASTVNHAIDEDRPVRQWFPTEAELATITLRSEPKKEHDSLRVVRIEGFDTQACGGTHAVSTAQVKLVRVISLEPYKGGARVTFAAGPRARASYEQEAAILGALASSFDVGPREVTASIDKLRRDSAALRARAKTDAARLAELVACELLSGMSDDAPIVALLAHDTVETMRAVGARIAERPGGVALLAAPVDGGLAIIAVRGESASLDCGAFVGRLAEACGARGGGRPDRAEARLPEGVDFVRVARDLV